ncbi:mediator of DNA damage checkpoint protein 1 isoform X2 [Cheilinus undulatus]|uniref:mediator of DNA damage checkpoint protein 1 isoform X2 n=1 Tax=Cheilinus undulatus TaxID=241271 RepID=UPI001BD69A48|nr:mediator of DNA damage checkpoint protein 1 isoform X2 [Cheilinus undulatus]
MEATLNISDSFLESDDEEEEENNQSINNVEPLAKLTILKNKHIPETELPLFLGDNVLGRDPSKCTLPLQAPSISKQHATICIYAKRRKGCNEVDKEALVWDQGSVNGTRKGLSKLTPNLRYALSEGDRLVVADIPCQFLWCTAEMHKKFLNGGPKALESLPEDTRNTPVRRNLLFSQPTPTDPRANLVTASDSDEEEGGVRRRRCQAQVSGSESFKSSPTCSTFLSPTNKMVLESVDESPVTPPSSSKNRPCRHVSFSKEETDVDAGRQQLEEKKSPAIVDVDEDTDLFHMGSDTDVDEDDGALDKVPKSLPSSGDTKPPHAISITQPESITMDSDTDVDDDGAVSGPATKAKPVLCQSAHTADSAPSTQLKDIHLDSDSDVEEEEKQHGTNNTDIKMDETLARLEIKPSKPELAPAAPLSPHPGRNSDSEASPAPAVSEPSEVSAVTESCTTDDKRADLDILSDSDTDVEEDSPPFMPVAVTSTSGSTDSKSKAPQPDSDADTDVDESRESTAGEGGIQDTFGLDSDTDVEEDSPPFIPVAVPLLSGSADSKSKAPQPDSDADTDVDESREPTAGEGGIRDNFGLDSDTDVEVKEGDSEEAGKQLEGMDTQAFISPSPGPFRGKQLEEMDTQAFTSSSPGPFRAPAGRPKTLSYLSDSSEDSDFVVAETQSFVLQTREDQENPSEDPTQAFCLGSFCDGKKEQSIRDGSFLLGLPESSHLQGPTQALAMESTQAFVPVEGGVALEETQAYAANSNADTFSLENDANLEATQEYVADEEDARGSVGSEKEGQVDLALEATQSYVIEPHSDSEDESDEGERKSHSSAEAQSSGILISSTLAMAETQSTALEKDEDEDNPVSSSEVNTDLCAAATQPMGSAEDEESDEEDSAPGPRKKKVKPLPVEEEDTQPTSKSEASADETQPMGTAENEESDEEDSAPGPRKKKVKPLPIEEEDTQPISKSEASADETQPMGTAEDEESDEEDSAPGPRKKKVKPLPIEEEDTQPISNSEAFADEIQPQEPNTDEGHQTGRGKKSVAGRSGITVRGSRGRRTRLGEEEEEETPKPPQRQTRERKKALPTTRGRKRKSKPDETEEEEKDNPLSSSEDNSDLCAAETQPMGTAEDEESDEEDSAPGPRKKKVKPLPIEEEDTQPISNPEASADETQPQEPNTDEGHHRGSGKQSVAGRSGITVRGLRGRRTRLGEEEEEETPEPPQRQTRGKKKALPTTRGRKRKSKPDETEEEEEDKNKEQRLKMERNKQGKEKLERKRQEEEERLRMENEERLRLEREQAEKERIEKERKEQEETERLEHEKAEREKKERLEKEEKEKKEKAEKQRVRKESEEQLQRERMEKLEMERLERENAERTEKERKDNEEKEKADRAQKEKQEKLERERNEKIEKEILEHERAEREENERKEQEEKLQLEMDKRVLEESLKKEKERQEEEKEVKEKQIKGQQEHKEEENDAKAPVRGRRAARRRTAASSTTWDSNISADDDVPVRITRSRSNSVSSERSTLSVDTPESRGRGRGRGAKRTSEPPSSATARRSNRIVAAGITEQDSGDISSQGALSRANSSTSLNSEISSCSLSTRNRGRGGRSRGRGRKLEADSVVNNSTLTDQNSTPKPVARGKMSRRADEPSIESLHEDDDKEEADLKHAGTTRGQRRASRNTSAAAEEEGTSNQESTTENSHSQRNIRGKGQKGVKSNAKDSPPPSAVNEGDGAKRKGRKRELEANKEEPSSSSSVAQGRENAQKTDAAAAEEEAKGETKHETPVQAKKRGRPSTAQAKTEKMEDEPVERKVRGRPSAAQNKRKEDPEESGSSVDQDAHLDALEPHTPTSIASRKRLAPADSSPAAKTPRSSSASSAAGGRSRAAGQAYKVLFTGIVDKPGERVLARLGGSMAKGVADMNCLVTDKVRRTVKFLCAVAKGVPIVTTQWLEESGKAGTLLCPDAFVVKDPEQEKKFSFCLQESLRIASSQPLLQGYVIHVTKSVMPEPVQMKDIISCSGATFLPKMPSSHKPQTVVISCEDDLSLCGPALSASIPVVSSEFILTGILQQKLDLQTHSLSASASNLQPAGGRGRGRKKT